MIRTCLITRMRFRESVLKFNTLNTHIMKKSIVSILTLFVLFTTVYSCQTDDDTTPPPVAEEEMEEEQENLDIIATINAMTDGSEKTWKIENAQITNGSLITDILALYSMEDDEFVFSTNTDTSIQLRHRRDYRINYAAPTLEELKSDVRVAPIETTLNYENTGEYQFVDANRYRFTYNEDNQTITGLQEFEDGITMTFILSEKTTADYLIPPTNIPSLSEVFSFEGSQPVLDMKYSFTTQSLYMANRKEQNEQQLIKYDFGNSSSVSQITTGGDYLAQQLAFIEDQIVTISSNEVSQNTLDLSGNPQLTTVSNFNGEFDFRTVAIENEIYKIGGYNGFGLDAISLFNVGDTSFSQVLTMAEGKGRVGAEIIDNKLYVIGGFKFDDQGNIITYNEMVSYDLSDMSTQIIALPVGLTSTFTARFENLLYIAGRKYNGPGIAATNYLTVYNTLDNSFQEIDIAGMLPFTMIMREMTVTNSRIYFAIQTSGTNNTFGISILEGSLN